MKIYDNGEYLSNNPSWHKEDSPWKAKQIKKIIDRNSLSPQSICEVGCGAGEILHQLAIHYTKMSFYGYEISPQAFEICRLKQSSQTSFLLQDIFETNSPMYDIVMAVDVVEHIEDYFTFLRKIKEKGDYKIFHIPLELSMQTILRSSPIINGRKSVGHIQYFTKETFIETLKDTGYEIIDYFYTNSQIELPHRGIKANLLILPRILGSLINKDLTARILGGYSLLVLAK